MIEDLEYEESKKIFLIILENRKIKPRAHDAFIAAKKKEALDKAYNEYKDFLYNNLINNDELSNNDKLDDLCNRLLDYSTIMANKLIDGFWDYDYSDEEQYVFNSYEEILDSLLKLHYEENNRNGKASRISMINRVILDNTKNLLIASGDANLTKFKNSIISLFNSFN